MSNATKTVRHNARSTRSIWHWIRLYVLFALGIFIYQLLAAAFMVPFGLWGVGIYLVAAAIVMTRWLQGKGVMRNQQQRLFVFFLLLGASVMLLWSSIENLEIGGRSVALAAVIAAVIWHFVITKRMNKSND